MRATTAGLGVVKALQVEAKTATAQIRARTKDFMVAVMIEIWNVQYSSLMGAIEELRSVICYENSVTAIRLPP